MTPETLVRLLHDQGADPREFALSLIDFLVWLDAGDHNLDELAERFRMTPAQALKAVNRREIAIAQFTA
jgi:predicted alpha/beta-hydrolase family hydrolase